MMPKFLKLPIYALDLSDLSYKYLKLEEKNGSIVVADFGEGEIPPGVINQGEIQKKDALVLVLKSLFSKQKINFVGISLPEEKGYLRAIKIFSVKEEELREALGFQLEEHIPLLPEEIVFEYAVSDKENGGFDVVVSAFPKKIIDSYAEAAYAAGALPVFAESEIGAALRAIVPVGLKEATMTIDLGRTRTSFSVFEEGLLRFTSTIHIGGITLEKAIADTLKVSVEKSQELKKQYGFLKNKISEDVFSVLVPAVTAIKEEAEKYLNYWQTHSDKKSGIAHIFLSGGDGNLLGLPEYLSGELGIPVFLANPWVNIKFPPKYLPNLEFKDSIRYASAIGVALRALKEGKTL